MLLIFFFNFFTEGFIEDFYSYLFQQHFNLRIGIYVQDSYKLLKQMSTAKMLNLKVRHPNEVKSVK